MKQLVALALMIPLLGMSQTDFVKRVNCGDSNTATYLGETFDPDIPDGVVYDYVGELKQTTGISTFTLNDQPGYEIFNRTRYTKGSSMQYIFYVLDGNYEVKLHYAEPYHGPGLNSNPADHRVFDIAINNTVVENDLCVHCEAGGANLAFTKSYTVSVNGGNGLTLDFLEVYINGVEKNDPIVQAIEVLGIDNSSLDNQPPTVPTNLAATNIQANSADISWSASSDIGGGNVSGYYIYNNGSQIANVTSGTSTTLSLTEDTIYNLSIAAYDNANPSNVSAASSPAVNFTTLNSGGNPTTNTSVWSESNAIASYIGGVAIGRSTVPNGYKLAVDGNIRTREVRVDQESWPDYVFDQEYDLPTLKEIQEHIQEKGHLPNIPSAKEVEAHGIELGEMNKLLLEKIEELTLHVLELNKKIQKLESNKN